MNKAGVVFLSEACIVGKAEHAAPISNLYVLVASLLSIIVDREPLTVYTGTGLVLAVIGYGIAFCCLCLPTRPPARTVAVFVLTCVHCVCVG